MKDSHRVIILAGANLGRPKENIAEAAERTREVLEELKVSSYYRTKPWGMDSENDFINQAWIGNSCLEPNELMQFLLALEQSLGRKRNPRIKGYQDRLIDLDILDFGGRISNDPELTLPHPRLVQRAFALVPLQELCPKWIHPQTELGVDQLLSELKVEGLEKA